MSQQPIPNSQLTHPQRLEHVQLGGVVESLAGLRVGQARLLLLARGLFGAPGTTRQQGEGPSTGASGCHLRRCRTVLF